EEKARVQADESLSDARRQRELKRLDGLATQLAKIAARDTSLLALLAEDARVSSAARELRAQILEEAGLEVPEEPEPEPEVRSQPANQNRVVPISALQRQRANPFFAPDSEAAAERPARPTRPAGPARLEPPCPSLQDA